MDSNFPLISEAHHVKYLIEMRNEWRSQSLNSRPLALIPFKKIYKIWNKIRVMLFVRLIFSSYPLNVTWLLKLPLDQNLITIYHKFNSDFKVSCHMCGDKRGLGVTLWSHIENIRSNTNRVGNL